MEGAYVFEGTATVKRGRWQTEVPLHFNLSLSPDADKTQVPRVAAIIATLRTQAEMQERDLKYLSATLFDDDQET